MTTPKEYTVRPGSIDSGRSYEIKTTALLALKCCLRDLEDFWIATNVKECGDFDDIVLFKKEKRKNGVTYLVQLKHQDTPSRITKKDILGKGKKNKDFSLEKYLDSCLKLSTEISNQTTNKSDFINHFVKNPDIMYIVFTNKDVVKTFEFLDLIKSSSDLVNINGNVYRFKPEGLDIFPTANDPKKLLIKNIFLYAKQPHIQKIDNKIQDTLKKLISSINKSDKQIDEISKKFIFFVEEWYRGRLDGHYPLTKTQILKKLVEILLEPFALKLNEENAFQNREDDEERYDVWEEMIEDKDLIVVNESDEIVDTFMQSFIYRFITKHQKSIKGCKTIKKDLMKVPRNTQIISFYETYDYFCKTNAIPLVVVVCVKDEVEEVGQILKIFKETFRVVILNKSAIDVDNTNTSKIMSGVSNLTKKQQEGLFKFPIKLQGRFLNGLEKLNLDIRELFKLKLKDIIYILCNQFNIGNELEALPDIFVNISLKRVWLKAEVLKETFGDVFVIHCEFVEDFKCFIREYALDIENSEIMEWTEVSNFNSHKIVLYSNDLKTIEDYFKNFYDTPIHFLIYRQKFKLEWVKSQGTTKNIKEFRRLEDFEKNRLITNEAVENFYSGMQPMVISSNPGMGKSVFASYFARNTSTDFWIVKINLAKYKTYYKQCLDEPEFHLKNFFEQVLEIECRENSNFAKAVFANFYESKNIMVLLDGFDEIPIRYRDDAKQFIKSLNRTDYFVLITTRLAFKNDLELLLDTFSMSLTLFTREDQKYFLKNHFSKSSKCNIQSTDLFVEQLLNAAKDNLNDYDNEFTGVPLQTLLLAKAFEGDFGIFLETKKFINRHFDLLDLYENFIAQKAEMAYKLYDDVSESMIDQFKTFRKLCALLLVFSEEDLKALEINLRLQHAKSIFPDMLELLQKDGIVVNSTETDIKFVHQTFAEYLAAQWLAENIKNENQEMAKNLFKVTFNPDFKFVRNTFDRILGRNRPLHLAVINHQIDKVASLINTIHFDELDYGNRSFLHLVASWGSHHPYTFIKDWEDFTFDFYEFYKLINTRTLTDEDDAIRMLELIPTEKLINCRDQILGFTPLDYAILNRSFHIANGLCQRLKLFPMHISADYDQYSTLDHCYQMNYLPLHRVIVNDICVDSRLCIDKKNQYSLTYVVSTANIEILYFYITQGIDLNAKDEFGSAPLHIAVRSENENISKLLIYSGADTNIQDGSGKTPLHWSVINGNLDITKLLISNGTDLNVEDAFDKAALQYAIISCQKHQIEIVSLLKNANPYAALSLAAFYGFTECVNLFVQLGIDTNNYSVHKTLHYAAHFGDVNIVTLLLSKGVNINAKDECDDSTSLLIAAHYGHTNLVKFLLDRGADVEAKDNLGMSALCWAIFNGHKDTANLLLSKLDNLEEEHGARTLCGAMQWGDKEVIELLLSRGARLESKAFQGKTALHWAAIAGRVDSVRFLLSKGADTNTKDDDGKTVLDVAVSHGNIPVVKLFLSKEIKISNSFLLEAAKYNQRDLINYCALQGVDMNFKDEEGMTALHYAVLSGFEDAACLLLSKDAYIEARNNHNETPFILACKNNDKKMVEMLLKKGANLEARTLSAQTPLIAAAENSSNDITSLLITKGANIMAKDDEGNTAFHWAVFSEYTTLEVIELFLSKSQDLLELRTESKKTPLILAVLGGSTDIVRFLLSKNVDIDAVDDDRMNALHWAILKRDEDIFYELLKRNAKLEAKNKAGRTALITAAIDGNLFAAELLVWNGANLNAKDNCGLSAKNWAKLNNDKQMIKVLKSLGPLHCQLI